jgi:hypothetical protein
MFTNGDIKAHIGLVTRLQYQPVGIVVSKYMTV